MRLCWLSLLPLLAYGLPLPFQVTDDSQEFCYIDPSATGGLRGALPSSIKQYHRLPDSAEKVVRPAVWGLSKDSAGLFVEFTSNASAISVKYTLTSTTLEMYHFPRTGVSGCDLYALDDDIQQWRWVGVTKNITYPQTDDIIATGLNTSRDVTYRLHLPTYNGLASMLIGVPCQSSFAYLPPKFLSPVVWYGTSILQGGVASRPGRITTHQVSRATGLDIFNFGFSGNGVMELSVAQYLVTVANPLVFIIDCLPNMNASEVTERTVLLVDYLRSHHPDTPIVLVEGSTYQNSWIIDSIRERQAERRQALTTQYQALLSKGVKGLHYVAGDQLLNPNNDPTNPTVAGTHPTDLGMDHMADYWIKYLQSLPPESVEMNNNRDNNRDVSRQITPQPLSAFPSHVVAAPSQAESDEYRLWKESTVADVTATAKSTLDDLDWLSASSLGVHGQAFNATPDGYGRLPDEAKTHVRDQVWSLSMMSTGLQVAFESNATELWLNYTTAAPEKGLWHMPATGTSGCDLYAYDESLQQYRFAGTVIHLSPTATSSLAPLITGLDGKTHRYILYLPLRQHVTDIYIGTPHGSSLVSDSTYPTAKPIVWYGTSIDQGGVASRAGMTYTNALSRFLNRTVLNFGFAGNGKMETNVAAYLNQIDAAMYVIDCDPNLDAASIAQRAVPLVKLIRQARPTTPIVLAEGTTYGAYWYNVDVRKDQDAKRAALSAAFDELHKTDANLHYVKGDDLWSPPNRIDTPTVGGTHPSDLGHHDIAMFYKTFLPPILQRSE